MSFSPWYVNFFHRRPPSRAACGRCCKYPANAGATRVRRASGVPNNLGKCATKRGVGRDHERADARAKLIDRGVGEKPDRSRKTDTESFLVRRTPARLASGHAPEWRIARRRHFDSSYERKRTSWAKGDRSIFSEK
jgi:hypothetical protein